MPAPAGTITFTLCGPAQVTAAGCPAGSGSQVGSPVTISAGEAASTPNITGITTPNDNTAGTYCWRADYTPDPNDHNYGPASHTDANAKCFTVADT
jgi:hypothetical protein